MAQPDLGPAAAELADHVRAVGDDQLGAPTPCPDYALGDLVEHVGGLARAFANAARKGGGPLAEMAGQGDASRLDPDWRTSIPAALDDLAAAWRDPGAWEGTTRIAGSDMPGGAVGVVALDELVLHGWDVARSLGRPHAVDDASLAAVRGFVEQFAAPEVRAQAAGLFGPVVEVPADAPELDRVLGLAGRDPGWSRT
jgi:uncharacterized protein (TIGR03086 family)